MSTIVRSFRNVHDFIRYDVPRGVRNLIRWFPVVWADRNYDQAYIYTILIRKLELQSRCFRRYGNAEDNDLQIDRMDRCLVLLGRLRDERSEEEQYDAHNARWGELVMDIIPLENPHYCASARDMIVSEGRFSRPKAVTPEEVAQERAEYLERMKAAQAIREDEKTELFTILREHLDEWWF